MSVPSPHKAFPVCAQSPYVLHSESGFLQTAADKTGRRKGRQRAARTRQPGHGVKQILRPHIRVFAGAKPSRNQASTFDLANRPVGWSVRLYRQTINPALCGLHRAINDGNRARAKAIAPEAVPPTGPAPASVDAPALNPHGRGKFLKTNEM